MNIMPYQSVGPLRFGMAPHEVEGLLGAPKAKSKNFLGGLRLVFPDLNVEFSNDEMVEATIGSSHEVQVHGQNIAASRTGREDLLSMSINKFSGTGTIILLDIGVAFSVDDDSPFPLTIFALGRMDGILESYERI